MTSQLTMTDEKQDKDDFFITKGCQVVVLTATTFNNVFEDFLPNVYVCDDT